PMGAVTAARLVGRTTVLDTMRQAVAAAVEGEPRMLVLEGEAGIGKSRLVAELAADPMAAADRVVVGHCSVAAGRHLPFGPWIDILRDLVRHVGAESVAGRAGSDRAVLSHLLPALGTAESLTPEVDAPSPGRVYEAVAGLLMSTALERPTVVVVEDLHWSDVSSRELLEHLVRVVRRERLLVIVTIRSDEPGTDDVAALVSELCRLPHVSRVVLPRLARDEVTEQVAALLGRLPAAAQVEEVMGLSEGVPFLVEEAVAADAGGRTRPGAFATGLVGHRLTRLSEAARQLVAVAAVGQDPLLSDLLGLASRLDARMFDIALREAMEARVLVVDPRQPSAYRFRHALLRAAAREQLMPGERAELNGRWGLILDGTSRLDPLARSAALARHWIAAEEPVRAREACVAAALEAGNVGAYPEQARWLEEAARFSNEADQPVPGAVVSVASVPAQPALAAASVPDPVAGLTGRELEVLIMVADGATNHDIAARLFISPKTASVHVSHILTKLAVRSRTEAAALAHRAGVVELGGRHP
ncbi:MAG TPA: AAA family ATPase, partial [Nocardioidaceae bacterium]|nr:AAA family ATPase [Nocardioidaceae bacterium]